MGKSEMKETGIWVAIIGSIILLSGITGITIYQDVFAGGGKVIICHKPGTPAERTITVSESAVPAHEAHGDARGACGGSGTGSSSVTCKCDGVEQSPVCTTLTCSDDIRTFCASQCSGVSVPVSCQSTSCQLP